MATSPPTRTPETEAQYLARGKQLFEAMRILHRKAAPREPFTIAAFIERLLAKRCDYRPNAWRFNRRAVSFTLEAKRLWEPWLTPAVKDARSRLSAADPVTPDETLPHRTSSSKARRFTEEQFEAVAHLALTRRTPTAERLVTFLNGTLLAGLRPCEWPGATLTMTDRPDARWILTVKNAKATNGRALGSRRELRWGTLSREHVAALDGCIAMGEQATYNRQLSTMSDLLGDLVRNLWPELEEFPTLYSARHEAIARWKLALLQPDQTGPERLIGLATIAALAGHVSDETAFKHYGRPRRGRDRISKFPIPTADPAAILGVRRRLDIGSLRPERKNEPEPDADL